MAKVTETTVPVVVPPRTFTVELNEAELATLVLQLGHTSAHQVKLWATSDHLTYDKEVQKAAEILQDTAVDHYGLYNTFGEALNA